ncbi:hypothetical protein [Burkholderia singularis]|uniref:hypothetical protein n=1 Tax=Burkholderia singularis TaxID=1503053 RepID=UPI002114C910|nr:hypothetical protein [Burkholderia singularis]
MEYGINPNLFWTWISQYQREQGGPRSPVCHESRLTRLTLSYRWYRCERSRLLCRLFRAQRRMDGQWSKLVRYVEHGTLADLEQPVRKRDQSPAAGSSEATKRLLSEHLHHQLRIRRQEQV